MSKIRLRLGHSPDPDDAFMFFGLAHKRIDTGDFEFEHILRDIETLNQWAMEGKLEVTAVSVHAFAYIHERYALLPNGASMGERYGPMVVAKQRLTPSDLPGKIIAIPGEKTTAFLVLKLCLGDFDYRIVPFDEIMEKVESGEVDAGLIIHEGQLTYRQRGLQKVLDLGEWWYQETELPLPLGCNVARKDLGEDTLSRLATILEESILYSLDHRDEAVGYAMQWARDMDKALADRFVGMYVNQSTIEYGERGQSAVQLLLGKGHERGLIPGPIDVQFVQKSRSH